MLTPQEEKIELHAEILNTLHNTFKIKNHDYGNSFFDSIDEDGLVAAKVRIKDKVNRFSNLIKEENQVKDESLTDTLLDLANYAIMTAMYLKWLRY